MTRSKPRAKPAESYEALDPFQAGQAPGHANNQRSAA